MGTFTLATGFGLLAVGLIAIGIGATCFYFITKRMQKHEQEEKEQKEIEERLNGSKKRT